MTACRSWRCAGEPDWAPGGVAGLFVDIWAVPARHAGEFLDGLLELVADPDNRCAARAAEGGLR